MDLRSDAAWKSRAAPWRKPEETIQMPMHGAQPTSAH